MTYTFIDYEKGKEKAAKEGFYLETLFVAIFLNFISNILLQNLFHPIPIKTTKTNNNNNNNNYYSLHIVINV